MTDTRPTFPTPSAHPSALAACADPARHGRRALTRAFWPLWSVLFAALGADAGAARDLPLEAVWAGAVLPFSARSGRWARGARVPLAVAGRGAGAARRTLPGARSGAARHQAIGAATRPRRGLAGASGAHGRPRRAPARRPDLRMSRATPSRCAMSRCWCFAVALLFGSLWRVGSVADMTPGGAGAGGGPAWEGWIEPPAYTGCRASTSTT
jgi:hypothetical protein